LGNLRCNIPILCGVAPGVGRRSGGRGVRQGGCHFSPESFAGRSGADMWLRGGSKRASGEDG
ncbi:hypothetical protein GUJ93_ZPchr0013g34093, partial [Zizania palustris]